MDNEDQANASATMSFTMMIISVVAVTIFGALPNHNLAVMMPLFMLITYAIGAILYLFMQIKYKE